MLKVLQFSLPQTVNVAIFAHDYFFAPAAAVAAERKFRFRIVAGLEIFADDLAAGDYFDPDDMMRFEHWVIHTADFDMQAFVGARDHRQMLFVRGFDRIGQHGDEFFAAAAHTRFSTSAGYRDFHCEVALGAFVQFSCLVFHDFSPY